MPVDSQRPFAVQHGDIGTCGLESGQVVEDAADVGAAEFPTGVQIELQEASTVGSLQDRRFRILPKVERNVAGLDGHNTRETFVVVGMFNVVYVGFIEGSHVDVLHNSEQQGFHFFFVGCRGAATHLHAEQEMVVLDRGGVAVFGATFRTAVHAAFRVTFRTASGKTTGHPWAPLCLDARISSSHPLRAGPKLAPGKKATWRRSRM